MAKTELATYQGEVIWIMGASSGIGRAVATALSARGARLILSARRAEELQQLNDKLGGAHVVQPLDVADAHSVADAVAAVYAAYPHLDRVIFMAAVYHPMPLDALDMAHTRQMLDVNLMGALYVLQALWPKLVAQEFAQLALCASVAGYMGLPKGQPYSATKAALINLAESLHVESPPHVDVKLICPGFVKTDLTAKNDFRMPFLIEPDKAAEAIIRGLPTRCFEIHFPKRLTLLLKLIRLLPYPLSLWMLKGL